MCLCVRVSECLCAQKLGEEGSVDESMAAMQQADALKVTPPLPHPFSRLPPTLPVQAEALRCNFLPPTQPPTLQQPPPPPPEIPVCVPP